MIFFLHREMEPVLTTFCRKGRERERAIAMVTHCFVSNSFHLRGIKAPLHHTHTRRGGNCHRWTETLYVQNGYVSENGKNIKRDIPMDPRELLYLCCRPETSCLHSNCMGEMNTNPT